MSERLLKNIHELAGSIARNYEECRERMPNSGPAMWIAVSKYREAIDRLAEE